MRPSVQAMRVYVELKTKTLLVERLASVRQTQCLYIISSISDLILAVLGVAIQWLLNFPF